MSREIKFRAFDDDAEHMFYSDKPEDDYFFEFKDGKLKGFVIRPPRSSSDPMEPPEPYCEDFPVEQYTGLLDKNGKEIYERDIVKLDRDDSLKSYDEAIIIYDDSRARFLLQHTKPIKPNGWIAKSGLIMSEDKTVLFGKFYWPVEVIGNIHQNPELLKK